MHRNPTVILREGRGWRVFRHPVKTLIARRLEEARPLLAQVEDWTRRGCRAAGFMAYEAAPAMDAALRVRRPVPGLPLAWFGVYRESRWVASLPPVRGECRLGPWRASVSRPAYRQAIRRIHRYLAAGDTYQVNLTLRLRTRFRGDPMALFLRLARAQPSAYTAWIDLGEWAVCCASPELFFEQKGNRVMARPMKGTAPRGRTSEEDERLARELAASPKNRSENVMIVDMIRNDLGRIARPGSVRVRSAYDIERYPTLWQMTSTVEGRTDAGFTALMETLFPCASITGAPKVRTMEIIRELEDAPRGLYTGMIGVAGPGRRALFNVAIRTAVLNRRTHKAEYGVGGGIVWDSREGPEYEECLTKARILTAETPEFELLETLRWSPKRGYLYLGDHLKRLGRSARYFGFVDAVPAWRDALRQAVGGLRGADRRVRLTVTRGGKTRVEVTVLVDRGSAPWRLGAARVAADSSDIFLYHKTTHRDLYVKARESRPDCDDAVLVNERGEVTETSIANLVVERRGHRLTPPVSSGLLPGVFRQRLLAQGVVRERVLTVEDLRKADRLYVVNSVRRWQPAVWVG